MSVVGFTLNNYVKMRGVSITHIPTGVKVYINGWRTQHENKREALKYLYSKLKFEGLIK